MARGRPALATVLMTVGVMALAVPLSSNFAGEFLILAGVFQQGWGWAVVGAVAIVLAAMYMLRLISAVLHREVGPAVSDAALDLRTGELAVVVPLVAILLVLSAWPDAISGHSFGSRQSRRTTTAATRPAGGAASDPQAARRLVRALAVARDARARPALLMMVAVFCAEVVAARRVAAIVCGAGFVDRVRASRSSSTRRARTARRSSPTRSSATAGRRRRRSSSPAAGSSPCSSPTASGCARRTSPSTTSLLAAAGAGMAFFVQAANLMTLFLGLEWFSIALYVLCAIDIDLVGSLEAGLKYLVIGAVGSATLLFGSALVYGATGQLSFDKIAAAGPHARLAARARPRDDHRRARVQGLGGAVPHVDARRLPGRADAGDRVHVLGDEGRGARRHATACSLTAFPGEEHLWTWAIAGDRDLPRSRSATSPRSRSGT